MVIFRRFLALPVSLFVGACGGTAPASPSPPSQPVSHVLSGTVFETVNGVAHAVADQYLALFIQETEGLPPGIGLRTSVQSLHTDSAGRYTAHVPKSNVFVSASWGKRQPCVASVGVDRDTTLDVQVFPAGSVASSTAGKQMITGSVYETTPNGRMPIQGADVWLDLFSDAYVANTETDAAGRFSFCGVWTTVRLDVSREGYQGQSAFFVPGDVRSFEFELKR